MGKWKDSRLYKPTCNHFDQYLVIASDYPENVFIGYGGWMPINDYTDGEWRRVTNTNGNHRTGAKVLYWMSFPEMPKDVEL